MRHLLSQRLHWAGLFLAGAAGLLTQCTANPSPDPVQSDPSIQWIDVPETAIASEMNPNPTPARVGENTWVQRGNQRVFDAVVEGQYVWYVGNCQSGMLYRLATGGLDEAQQPQQVEPYPNEQWFEANEFQAKILDRACALP